MKLRNSTAEIFVPDGKPVPEALARTTHLGVSAHQDDLEIMAFRGILECFGVDDKWFLGVVVTNGAGSPRDDLYKDYTDEEMMVIRRKEQKKAAFVGEYAAQFLLDHPSSAVKDASNPDVVADLKEILLAARPAVCRQVVLRAVASGYRVAVVTDVPDRWRPLLAIADETRYRIVDPDASDAGAPVDAVVWDVAGRLSEARIDAFAGPGGPDVTPPTVIRVDADWGVGLPHDTAAGAPPDLVLDGRIDGWISVEPRGGEPYRVSVVAGPDEERYVGGLAEVTPAGAAPSASPDRR